jgi:hypothetical protein
MKGFNMAKDIPAYAVIDDLLDGIRQKSNYVELDRVNAYTKGYLTSMLINIYKTCPESRDIIMYHVEKNMK